MADKLALADAARMLVVNALQPELADANDRASAANPVRRCGGMACPRRRDLPRIAARARHRTLPLPGEHNALNVCAALAAIEAAGEDALAALGSIGTFRALPHRLQALGEHDGITWINDSIATTPQATLEALASLAGRAVTVLVGGHDRGLDWHAFADGVQRDPPHAIVTMGANGARIAHVLREASGDYELQSTTTLREAVEAARGITPSGGIVLLSPGAPSFDQFRDYVERGRAFAALAGFDPDAIGAIEGLGIA